MRLAARPLERQEGSVEADRALGPKDLEPILADWRRVEGGHGTGADCRSAGLGREQHRGGVLARGRSGRAGEDTAAGCQFAAERPQHMEVMHLQFEHDQPWPLRQEGLAHQGRAVA